METILAQIARLDRLLGELLTMTQRRAPQPEAVDVAALLAAVAADHRRDGVTLRVEAPATLPAVLDAALLRRLRVTVEQITDHRFNIACREEGAEPEFMLVNDSHDGSCWLWDYTHGRRFLEASEPVEARERSDDIFDEGNDRGPKLLGS